MKSVRIYFVLAAACMLASGLLFAADAEKKLTCCEQAAKNGKECTHKCCVAAHREGKSCEKCNPDKQDLKSLKNADKAKK